MLYNQNMQYIFYLPGILFLISGIPQTRKLLRTKSSQDISLTMYLLTLLAITIVVIDAFRQENMSILASNLASLCITGLNTFLVIKYRRN